MNRLILHFLHLFSLIHWQRERQTDRQREKETERERERKRQRETRQREREREREIDIKWIRQTLDFKKSLKNGNGKCCNDKIYEKQEKEEDKDEE